MRGAGSGNTGIYWAGSLWEVGEERQEGGVPRWQEPGEIQIYNVLTVWGPPQALCSLIGNNTPSDGRSERNKKVVVLTLIL